MSNRLLYYFRSIPTITRGIKNWWALPSLLMSNRPFTLQLQSGLQFQVRTLMDVWIIKETCLDRDYEIYGTPIQPGWTVVDIGAGLGDFTVFAAHKQPTSRVIGLEPFPESFALLEQNLTLNKIKNVKILPTAVGKENGRLQLATTGAAVQHSTSHKPNPDGNAHLIEVETMTLPGIFAQYHIDRCHFLKMDCEGAEFDILFHTDEATLAKIDHLCLEYHDHITPHSHLELVDFLTERGFEVTTTPNPVHAYLGFLYGRRL